MSGEATKHEAGMRSIGARGVGRHSRRRARAPLRDVERVHAYRAIGVGEVARLVLRNEPHAVLRRDVHHVVDSPVRQDDLLTAWRSHRAVPCRAVPAPSVSRAGVPIRFACVPRRSLV